MSRSVEYYTSRAGSWSKRQLGIIQSAIDGIENSNWFVRHFSKKALEVLELQKKYVAQMVEKEKELLLYKKMFSPTQQEIVKANKALEKQISRGEEVKYVSKREENREKQVKKKGRPKGKPRGPRKKEVIKASELKKPTRIIYD